MLPIVQHKKSFKYLGRYFNYAMDNSDQKHELLSVTERLLEKIDLLPLHPRCKLELYGKYVLPKISWHLTIIDINITWVKQTLDMIYHNTFRSWFEIPANGTLDILLQAKPKFGLNIIDISTKHTQCQIILRNKLNKKQKKNKKKTSRCCDILLYTMIRVRTPASDRYLSAKHALKEIRKDKIGYMLTNFTSQSLVFKAMWEEAFAENVAIDYQQFAEKYLQF